MRFGFLKPNMNPLFCVECGAEGKVYESLCEKCFLERHSLAELPEYLDIEKCKECEAFLVGSKWIKVPMERAVEMLLDKLITYERIVDTHQYSVEYTPEDEMNYQIVVHCDMFVDEMRTEKDVRSKVRLKPSQCVTCTRRKSRYYEATLQIRADRRNLSDEEMEAVNKFVHKRVDSATDEFISEEEKMHGGWDFLLSSKNLARNIAKELASQYCAQDSSAAKLVGMKDGVEMYRVTHLVRLPHFKVGDVIDHHGKLYQIMGMATNVAVMNIEDWSKHSFTPSELIGSTAEDCFRLKAVLLAESEDEMQIMDPDTMKTVTIKKPEGFHPEGEEISIIKCEKGIFPAPPQKD
jgi:nonsense-mediated mRNA decay protein 3